VPKAMARVFELFEEKNPVVSFFPFRSSVPAVNVSVRAELIVISSASCTVPPAPLIVMMLSIVLLFEVIICVPDVAAKVCVAPLIVHVVVVPSVKFP